MIPTILLIDDEAATIPLPDNINATRKNPTLDVFGADFRELIQNSDVVLLDHNLQLPQEISLQATDGASFVGHLRSWARKNALAMPPIVIYTSEDEAFANEIPEVGPAIPLGGSFVGREAKLAPALDVEWLIRKDDDRVLDKIESITKACSLLRNIAENDKCSFAEIEAYLGLPSSSSWTKAAQEHLKRSRPPISEGIGSEVPRGISPVFRWLLQRALPYSGLFLSDLQAAWTLGIPPAALEKIVKSDASGGWVKDLCACVFLGPASALFPRRWWAAGVEYAGWQLRSEQGSTQTLAATLQKLTGFNVEVYSDEETVVVVDEDLNEIGLCNIEGAVQLHPRGWPAEASEPWACIDLVKKEPLLRAMLDPADKEFFFQ
ncbi:hypothetical protein IHQ71_31320 (plasmid) [Rhizobium sp. TH2]|uniref:hypothetical protein n=1 Tax=Rhizobium sp. TH2 TaxID=2775403 RepID=UPI0021571602|nr:hypothetical protein [Rhizobium sp. TH2]UVC12657.1 hypothetical protein IHQ71_31320 [Rhizobium sp. TH2]